MTIILHSNDLPDYRRLIPSFSFPGGEINVDVSTVPPRVQHATLRAYLTKSEDIMKLLLTTDALRRRCPDIELSAYIPYVPYARQDRVCNPGEALSIKVMADLINSCNFKSVHIVDPHSDVTPALINNCIVKSVEDIFKVHFTTTIDTKSNIFVAPDAGALKKVQKVARTYEVPVISAEKVRDTKTGEIIDTKIHITEELIVGMINKRLTIIDDICDGGRTFIEIAKKLQVYLPKEINLYVTHGIFSQGLDPLIKAGINHVFTTNSYERKYEPTSNITVLPLHRKA